MIMALSRLRHHVVARSPSIFRVRIPLSSTIPAKTPSSNRASSTFCSLVDGGPLQASPTFYSLVDGGHLQARSLSFFSVTGVRGTCYILKAGGRQFSSSDSSHIIIAMPALTPTMTQGNIAKWRKKEGDKIDVGDVICEIETDKATVEFESLEEGFLAKILVPEGTKDVTVGQPIAITVEDANDIENVAANDVGISEFKTDDSTLNNSKREITPQKGTSVMLSTSELPQHIILEMPALSPTMNQGNITTWRKKEGDKIDVGDVICEIETDKATLEYECLEEGYLAKILAPEGSKDVAVGHPIAVTVEDADDIEVIRASSFAASGAKEDIATPHEHLDKPASQEVIVSRISPAAKLLIAKSRLDASLLKASGPHGTLLKRDVLDAVKLENKSPTKPSSVETTPSSRDQRKSQFPSDSFEDLPNSQIRKVIARRLLESKQSTPHLYLSSDVTLDPLLQFRKELQELHGIKVSVNDIVIKVVAVALRNVPEANAYWDTAKGKVVLCDSVDISIAVATEKGLMTPIVRNADQKTISSISSEVKALAEKARAGKLAPHEFQGGTFSISNLGMFPVDHFCAIINPPQACILAVGRGNKIVEPVIGNDGIEKPAVVTKMVLALSADHRVFDGKVGGTLFSALKLNFGDIRRLLL